MTENPSASFLANAIREHRDTGDDDKFYLDLTTYEVHEDHGGLKDDYLQQTTQLVRAA